MFDNQTLFHNQYLQSTVSCTPASWCVTMFNDWTEEKEQTIIIMLTDSLLLVGLAVAIVLLILVGCKIVIDFPGLLDGNIVHTFKQINADEEVFKNIKVIENCTPQSCRLDLGLHELTDISEIRRPETVAIQVETLYPDFPQTATQEESVDEAGIQSRINETRQESPDKDSATHIKHKERKPQELHNNMKIPNKHQNIRAPDSKQRTPVGHSSFSISSPDTSTTSSPHSKSRCKVTQINIIRGKVNIVIKSQPHKENYSINIDFPGDDVSKPYEPPEDMINNPSETGHDDTEREEMVQCQFYQTKEQINRHC